MKLILRKNDSATSLLLFVYNLYYTKTSEPYIKLSTLLKVLQCFDKNETAIRMSLSRAVKTGFLVNYRDNGEVFYALSQDAMHAIQVWNDGVNRFWRRYALRHKAWDGNWHILKIALSEHKQNKSDIIDQLQQLGFTALDSSTWISPYYQKNEIALLADRFSIREALLEIVGDIEPGVGISAFCERTFGLAALKERYAEFAQSFEDTWKNDGIEIIEKEAELSGSALVFLHELGWRFFDIASDDAVLPEKLCPSWAGDRAAKLMKELRPQLLDSAWKFIEQYR